MISSALSSKFLKLTFVLHLALVFCGSAAEVRVSTDFEGGSARVESVEQDARVIHLMPGGDPQRGWPCWWFVRVEGVEKDARWTIDLGGSDRPARNNGKDTGKPLDPKWSMPVKAAFSTDGKTWQQTAPGRRQGKRILYEVTGTGSPLWVAWGPPFTPADTDALLAQVESRFPSAKGFDLARTREGRTVRAVRIGAAAKPSRGIWVQARQHAWESGASWVARGLIEWLTGDDPDALWLRENAEIVVVPIMDVDNAATGNGGKEAAPRDHNRDWSDQPVYPEVSAAQKQLGEWGKAGHLDMFLDLHNPGPADLRPFFFMGPAELLDDTGRQRRADFLASARRRMTGPLALEPEPRITGADYHPLWRQMSGLWVNGHADPRALAACLETSWNTPHSTTDGYLTVGRQLGQAMSDYIRHQSKLR
jgi:hypothetical protein